PSNYCYFYGHDSDIQIKKKSVAEVVPATAEIEAYRKLMLEWFDEDDTEMLEREDRATVPDP
ncbi:MAG: hypothetical protein AAF513_18660, partial [Pseudomonadota bacterium]